MDIDRQEAAVSAWANEAELVVDEAALRTALTSRAEEDDPVAADSALDAMLNTVGLIHPA